MSEIPDKENPKATAKKLYQNVTNEKFIANTTDPNNGRIVKSIWAMKITKLGREKWDMIWQYYRDRNRKSVSSLYSENPDTRLRIIYSGDPVIYNIGSKPVHDKTKIPDDGKKFDDRDYYNDVAIEEKIDIVTS